MKNLQLRHRFKAAMRVLFWEVDYQGFEVFNGVMMLILGISFMFFAASKIIILRQFENAGSFPIYIIAAVMILFGIVKFYGILKENVRIRKWVACFSVFLWGFLFVVFSQPPVKPPSLVFMVILIGFSLWAYIRLVLLHRGVRLVDPRDPYTNE